jgi:hypothetical protein
MIATRAPDLTLVVAYRLVSCWWRACSAGCCSAFCHDATSAPAPWCRERGRVASGETIEGSALLTAVAIEKIISAFVPPTCGSHESLLRLS